MGLDVGFCTDHHGSLILKCLPRDGKVYRWIAGNHFWKRIDNFCGSRGVVENFVSSKIHILFLAVSTQLEGNTCCLEYSILAELQARTIALTRWG